MHIQEIIEVFTYSDSGVGSFVAFVAGVVIVYDVAIEPMAVTPVLGANVSHSEISVVELFGWSDVFVGVDDCDLDALGEYGGGLVVGFDLE